MLLLNLPRYSVNTPGSLRVGQGVGVPYFLCGITQFIIPVEFKKVLLLFLFELLLFRESRGEKTKPLFHYSTAKIRLLFSYFSILQPFEKRKDVNTSS